MAGSGTAAAAGSLQSPVSHRFMPGPAQLVLAKAKVPGEEGDLEPVPSSQDRIRAVEGSRIRAQSLILCQPKAPRAPG